jgi:hypothetical protein
MTVEELLEILGQLPNEVTRASIYVGAGGVMFPARCVIVVPECFGDPLSPRVELREALVYRPALGAPWNTTGPASEPADAGGPSVPVPPDHWNRDDHKP